eukprot:Gregarina_sp_Poly_1__5441@NODE_2878_length_1603_cov_57_406901_g254_i1_p1_GENE_NODE_2878_length_1603_cov_57_406901_g254_i1NODE_2878_length_1603_cov_57_406901_g254_i1_p1_ORF_typecomplete_len330_score35_63Peptidase_C97/PF05903_14/1_6e22PUB/PF09409_10/3_5e13UBA/PF00627_31/0_01UBA_5/PF16577_5/6e03UBA_5/PF16577_5/0_025CDC24/PF06395_11/0_14_NODE_2878_length_1603_cov_57_406901_g254_i196992
MFEIEHNIQVSRVLEAGSTDKSLSEIHRWVQANEWYWSASTYDLISKNCNHFSNELLKFLLNSREDCVPRDILHQHEYLPPFAQSLLPLIRSFQDQITGATAPTVPGFPPDPSGIDSGPSQASMPLPPMPPPPTESSGRRTPFTCAVDKMLACGENQLNDCIRTVRTLFTLANNVKQHATEKKYRSIKSSNDQITKLLNVRFGEQCLEQLGFQRDSSGGTYSLEGPPNRDTLLRLQADANYCTEILEDFQKFTSGNYATQISQLKDMGFSNDFWIFRALVKSRGLIDGALDHLTILTA